MERVVRRRGVALAGALLALGALPVTHAATPAAAVTAAGACNDSTGITVVVDLTAFDGGVQVRCAPQPVATGFDALKRAGFTYQGTVRFPGLLCRIDGEPSSDPCQGAPPPNAYWAYWHAPRGGDWTYSTSGAGSRKPPPGSVEGWAFGDEAQPGIDPPAAPATTTTRPASPTTTRPPTGSGGATPSPGPTGGSAPAVAGATATTTTSSSVSDDGSTTTTSADRKSTAAADDRTGDDELAGAPVSDGGSSSDGGSPVGAAVGLVVALGLGAAGIRSARRRAAGEPA